MGLKALLICSCSKTLRNRKVIPMSEYLVAWDSKGGEARRYYHAHGATAQEAADNTRRLFPNGYVVVVNVSLICTDWE